jgi:four helix bundle protein
MANTRGETGFDLEDRTARFGENVIRFAKTMKRSPVNDPLISQVVRAATSVGANYCEANDGVSKRDFRNKIGLCRKESHEAKHWLRMIAAANENMKEEARVLWQEAKELNLIFSKIFRSSSS